MVAISKNANTQMIHSRTLSRRRWLWQTEKVSILSKIGPVEQTFDVAASDRFRLAEDAEILLFLKNIVPHMVTSDPLLKLTIYAMQRVTSRGRSML